MAVPLLLLVLLAMFTGSDGAWCVCKPGQPDATLQKAIDYACGKGADCAQTMQNWPCYSSMKTLVCSYIVNSYFQKNGPIGATCDFGGLAYQTNTDPSSGTCKFASGPSSAGGAGTGGAGAGAGTGGAGGAGAGMMTPGSSTLSPPFGNAYGPSGLGTGPDYNAAAVARPGLAAAAVLAAAPLAFRFFI